MDYFDHQSIFFTTLGYPMSYLEFFGTVAGAIAVYLSARAKVWSWPLGIINVTLFFFLFYQIQLYPDMFLQVFFFLTNLIGWWRWTHPKTGEDDRKHELRVSWMPKRTLLIFSLFAIFITGLSGALASNLNELLPILFNKPSAFPYADSFVMVVSICATYLMVEKKVECWLAWLVADIVATFLYFSKGILFVGVEYFVFCLIAVFGFFRWQKEFKSYSQ